MKVSAGALEQVKIAQVTTLSQTINYLKKQGYWIVGTDMQGTKYNEIDYSGKTVIIITHDEKVAKCCQRVINLSDGKIV